MPSKPGKRSNVGISLKSTSIIVSKKIIFVICIIIVLPKGTL